MNTTPSTVTYAFLVSVTAAETVTEEFIRFKLQAALWPFVEGIERVVVACVERNDGDVESKLSA